jgi:hypothetical protein
MKVVDKTPFQDEKGQIGLLQRVQGTLKYGFSWYGELEAQKVVVAQLDRALEKGFALIRNLTLPGSEIIEPIILIGPPGIYVIYVTDLSGFFEAKGDQWNTLNNGRATPAPVNLMNRAKRLARALQVYIERQGVSLVGPVEPILMATSPAMHIDSIRPAVRVVMSDAVKQFAASLLQAQPLLRSEFIYDLADRLVTPRPKSTPIPNAPVDAPAPAPQADEPAPSRAQAIFQAAQEVKPFNPSDMSFAFDENSAQIDNNLVQNLRESSPSQLLPQPKQKRGLSMIQWIFLAAMLVIECCVVAGFAYFIFLAPR